VECQTVVALQFANVQVDEEACRIEGRQEKTKQKEEKKRVKWMALE
jgi:hypothetical protein